MVKNTENVVKQREVSNICLLHSSETFLYTLWVITVLTVAGTMLTCMWLAKHVISVYQLLRMCC